MTCKFYYIWLSWGLNLAESNLTRKSLQESSTDLRSHESNSSEVISLMCSWLKQDINKQRGKNASAADGDSLYEWSSTEIRYKAIRKISVSFHVYDFTIRSTLNWERCLLFYPVNRSYLIYFGVGMPSKKKRERMIYFSQAWGRSECAALFVLVWIIWNH